MDYEEARRRMQKEAKNHNPYTAERMKHYTKIVEKKHGAKTANELIKETMSVRKKHYGTKAD